MKQRIQVSPFTAANVTLNYLTAKDLETILQIDVKTIYGYVRDGLIPHVRIQSNIRFRRDEIMDWIEKQSYRPRQSGRVGKERQPTRFISGLAESPSDETQLTNNNLGKS